MLLKLKREGQISQELYNNLIPGIYGLPKIHKPGVPFRPIVSFLTSGLSKYVVKILSPLVGTTSSFFVRSSKEFVDFIIDQTLLPGYILSSFDSLQEYRLLVWHNEDSLLYISISE